MRPLESRTRRQLMHSQAISASSGSLHSAYLADKDAHIAAADKIGAFLVRPEVTARIEAAFFRVDDPRLQKLLSDSDFIA
jgi:hypothetical protein